MIKERFSVINILCFLTAIIYVETAGLVNEFNIEDSNNTTETNETEHHNFTKPDMSPKIISKKQRTSNETKTKDDLAENGTLLHDSMYTESDLEETKSTENNELDGPDSKEKEANNTHEKHKRKEEISSVYTESDLEATASQDEKKGGGNQEKDKKSTESYLVVLHKRDINDAEQEDGSGEGSGQEPLTNNTN